MPSDLIRISLLSPRSCRVELSPSGEFPAGPSFLLMQRGEPIPWIKVTYLPDHVYFSHQQHIRSGIDCARCHGDVEQMDRVYEENRLLMGFCVECHRGQTESELPLLDCVTCHQ